MHRRNVDCLRRGPGVDRVGEKEVNVVGRPEHAHFGGSPSAHLVAASLWLHRLSMTEGNFVNTIPVEGVCRVVFVVLGAVDVGGEKLPELTSPVSSQQPRVLGAELVCVLSWLSRKSGPGRWH